MNTILSIYLPEYDLSPECDFDKCGRKVDRLIEEYFFQNPIVIRAIGLCEHSGFALDELVTNILNTGTDKFEIDRKSIFDEDFMPYQFDFHGCAYRFDKGKLRSMTQEVCSSEMGSTFRAFYEHAPSDRGYPVRIDLLLVYRLSDLIQVEPISDEISEYEKKLVSFLFHFKRPVDKVSALIGIIKILN